MNARGIARIGWLAAGTIMWAGAGCTADVGPATSGLAYVSTDVGERADLFIDRSVGERPLTLAQLGLSAPTAQTIPVEVEVFGEVAVAWNRHEGEILRNRANIVGLYHVVDRVEISGEVDQNDDGPVYVDVTETPVLTQEAARELGGSVASVPSWYLVNWENRLEALERFRDSIDESLVRALLTAHPGCE